MKRIFIMMITIGVIFLTSCQQQDPSAIEKETVEGFIIEESDGTSSYKKVNAITYVKENKHVLIFRIRIIEDYYDASGTFVKTEIMHSYSEKSKMLMTNDRDEKRVEVNGPATINLPDDTAYYSNSKLNDKQREEIREHVMQVTGELELEF
ncbi:hypothetical protein ACX1C1_19870 [Paenibacillus sp. strain BS8-2]